MTPQRKIEYAERIAQVCGSDSRWSVVLPILEEALKEMAQDVSADYAEHKRNAP